MRQAFWTRLKKECCRFAGDTSGISLIYVTIALPVLIRNFTFTYIFLNGLVPGLTAVNMPGLNTTITGEDLRKVGS
jgi:hypothetical protein